MSLPYNSNIAWTAEGYRLTCALCKEITGFPRNYRPEVNCWPALHHWVWSRTQGWCCPGCGTFIAAVEEPET